MMKITFLGTGTSTGIPQIGCRCETCTSLDEKDKRLRASLMIETPDSTVIIDAGPDFRQQMLRHLPEYISGVLLTHEHYDHIGGLDDLRTFGNVSIYAENKVLETIRRNMPYCFSEKLYPGVPLIDLHKIDTNPFKIVNTAILPIRIMHARLPILGFRIGKMAYLTDVKTIPEESYPLLEDLDLLILNALRHAPHIAHLNLEDALIIAGKIGAKQTFFTHFSHDLGKHEIVSLNLPPTMHLSYDGLVLSI
jgi:phosphoribosyl 1,2-cyclic phosphate phosphodiesterase